MPEVEAPFGDAEPVTVDVEDVESADDGDDGADDGAGDGAGDGADPFDGGADGGLSREEWLLLAALVAALWLSEPSFGGRPNTPG